MALGFGQFNRASRGETPRFAAAAQAEGQEAHRAKAQSNALRSQNMIGGAQMYNAGMGDRSPIADALFGPQTTTMPAGNDLVPLNDFAVNGAQAPPAGNDLIPLNDAPLGGAQMTPLVDEGAVQATEMIGEELATEGLADAALSTGTEAVAGGAGGSAMAASMPYLSAALLAYNLLS